MDKRTDVNNTSFAYSVNLLKMLLAMQLITEDEYERITQISAEHYGADLIYVWKYSNYCGMVCRAKRRITAR